METEQQDKKILKTSMRSYLEGFYDWVLMPKLFKVPFYLFVVVVCSFIHGFQPLPQSYLSNKRNVLNVYFVKFGWGWTLLVLIPFISFTSSLYTSLNPLAILKHLRRMAVATCGWYIWVNLFWFSVGITVMVWSDHDFTTETADHPNTGPQSIYGSIEDHLISLGAVLFLAFQASCGVSQATENCYQEGFYWNGFDISEHCFLLTYSALVISEELQPKLHWPSITSAVVQTNPENINGFQHRNIARLVTPFVDVFSLFAGLLSILWEFMLVFTTIYFHTVHQKVLGAGIAIFTWYITYRVWYHDALSPGLPWVPNDKVIC
ncbi:fat storage-inducing transmembrane protein 2-like [Pocillopora damicornis]|uniref:fat storage-inducing transmembrane protein 2-like n=1 Tax=Pocillopora damicornis TaxID=46731 RepID=UPI000F557793|nr:fat storage-inducing transmembrane protein 2-like [Pocillopora damicornis]